MRPGAVRPLLETLSEAKDVSELMLDLAFGSLFYADRDLADEVLDLEEELNGLVHEMRQVCLLAARSPADAGQLASMLQLIGSIEMIGNQAVDVAKILVLGLGIPDELREDLARAAEVVHRVEIRAGSPIAGRPLHDSRLPNTIGMRIIAIRRRGKWLFDPDGDEVLAEADVLVTRGRPDGVPKLRELAGAGPAPQPAGLDVVAFNELDKAVDIVVEMKNLAEVCVGLGYASLLFGDRTLAIEVNKLEDELDRMRGDLESWVLEAAAEAKARRKLRGLLRLAVATETIGDAAQAMVWLVEHDEPMHPILADALGASDDEIDRAIVAPSSPAAGGSLSSMELRSRAGVIVLALRRGGTWQYRPASGTTIEPGDELVLTGPPDSVEEAKALLTAEPS